MTAQGKFVFFSGALLVYLCAMVIRHVYLGYFKYPKLIEHYRQIGDEAAASYWEQWMKRCKGDLIWRYVLLTLASAFALGTFQLGEFFLRASQP